MVDTSKGQHEYLAGRHRFCHLLASKGARQVIGCPPLSASLCCCAPTILCARCAQANDLRREYEVRWGVTFDAAVQLRPDLYRSDSPTNATWALLAATPSTSDAIFSCRDMRWPGMKGGDMCFFVLSTLALDRLYDAWHATARSDLAAMACAWKLRSKSCRQTGACKASTDSCSQLGRVDPGQGFAENLLGSALSKARLHGFSQSVLNGTVKSVSYTCRITSRLSASSAASLCLNKKYTPCPIMGLTRQQCEAQCQVPFEGAKAPCGAVLHQDLSCFLVSSSVRRAQENASGGAALCWRKRVRTGINQIATHGEYSRRSTGARKAVGSLPLIALGNKEGAPGYDGKRSGWSGWWLRLTSACDTQHEICTLWSIEPALLPAPRCPVNCRLAPRPSASAIQASDALLVPTSKFMGHFVRNGSSFEGLRPVYCLESEAGTWRLPRCPPPSRSVSTHPNDYMRFSFFTRYYLPSPLSTTNAAALFDIGELQRAQFRIATLGRNASLISVWFKHCHVDRASLKQDRTTLLNRLEKAGLGVASYGRCMRNIRPDDSILNTSQEDWQLNKQRGMKRHPFVLVSENSAQPGWVTEKVYQALAAGVVPVWFGTPAGWAERYLFPLVPPNSVVDASSYRTPAQLAHFLRRAARNASIYESFHRWRHEPDLFATSVAILQRELSLAVEATPCRICQLLHKEKLDTSF